jgi:D-alanyl-D-alanine carboxypeptidase
VLGAPILSFGVLLLALACAGCAGGTYGSAWDGRRGYDGNGDYGYDLAASRSEASSYRARAAAHYPVPGTPDDPWGPYIREGAARFQIPEKWIRAVMHQESGGHEYGASGAPITSGAGAMGLMQVMPRTYDTLRRQYNLGPDPFDPHDNILAGCGYIRDMYAIYGAPGFLAAYNAGPNRLDSYLAGSASLPDETVNYLASIAPHLGNEVAMTGPLAVYAGPALAGGGAAAPPSRSYVAVALAPPVAVEASQDAARPVDPADRAYDGGGLVTPDAPTGAFGGQIAVSQANYSPARVAPVPIVQQAVVMPQAAGPSTLASGITLASLQVPAPNRSPPPHYLMAPAALVTPAEAATLPAGGGWAIQIGAFPDPALSQSVIARARARAADLLAGTQPAIIPVQHGGTLYRARLVGLSAASAAAACDRLAGAGMACYPVPPGG